MWTPLPQRRVLLENASFIYAFGNTPHTSLYRDSCCQQEATRLLLLGFGDVRNVLATAAGLAGQPGAKCQRLEFTLNDYSALNVARGLLLLHLASTIDPALPDDLDFFWAVTYNLSLTLAHADRLAAAVRSLLAQPAALGEQLPDAEQAEQMEAALRGWLEPQPSVEHVRQERQRLLLKRLSLKAGRQVRGAGELADLQQGFAEGVLLRLHPWPADDGLSKAAGPRPQEVLRAECMAYLSTGTICLPHISPDSCTAVNPTLLQPGSRRWLLHYASLPFLGYLPLDPGRHPGLRKGPGPGALTEACMSELRALLQGWQACRAARQVAVRFWCCDALALCAGPLMQQQQQQQQQQRSDKVASGAGFDVIDCSNVPDHVGLLSVLALTAPLLRQAPHSRLFTGHMLWASGCRRLQDYVRKACGADPQLLPSLLGLRLMNDPQYGLTLPDNPLTNYGQTDIIHVLEWAPAPLQPAAVPFGGAGSDGIAAALRAWGDLACACKSVPADDRSGLRLGSPLTLLHAVAGMAARGWTLPGLHPQAAAAADNDSDVPGWRRLADCLADACSLPPHYSMQLRALCCWALQEPGQQALLVQGRVPLSPAYRECAEEGRTPLLSIRLLPIKPGPLPAMLEAVARVLSGSATDQRLDVLGFDAASEELSFLLPPDHGLDLNTAPVMLDDVITSAHLTDMPVALFNFSISPALQQPPAALTAGLRCLLQPADRGSSPAFTASTASTPAKGTAGAMALSSGLQLRRLAEHADRFEIDVFVEESAGGTVNDSSLKFEFPGAPLGGGACDTFKVTFAPGGKLRPLTATLTLPWPIDSVSGSLRVSRSARTITATLPKHPLWPSDSTSLPKMDMEALPAWGSGKRAQALLSSHLSSMFSHPEMQAKSKGLTLGAGGSTMFDVKESIQALFVRFVQNGSHTHALYNVAARDQTEPAITLFIHGGVRRLPDGRPLLHISYVDHSAAERMHPNMLDRAAPLARFTRVVRHCGGLGMTNSVQCTEAELRILRYLLARNAQGLRVPKWQSSLLELPSEWQASFVVPVYSDYIALGEAGQSQLEELPSITADMLRNVPSSSPLQDYGSTGGGRGSGSTRSQPQPPDSTSMPAGGRRSSRSTQAGSSSGGSTPAGQGSSSSSSSSRTGKDSRQDRHQQAVRLKEEGNAAFKRQDFASAARLYREAVGVLKSPAASASPGDAGKLLVDLLNNMGLALIKHADARPAEAAGALRAAEAALSMLLQVAPSNSKALYRRATALHKQGKLAEAQRDLSGIPGSGDAAVEALRQQVQAALRMK